MKRTMKKLRLDRMTVRDLVSGAVRGGIGPVSDESCDECGPAPKDPNESHAATCGNGGRCASLNC